jgi:hypothetical protein
MLRRMGLLNRNPIQALLTSGGLPLTFSGADQPKLIQEKSVASQVRPESKRAIGVQALPTRPLEGMPKTLHFDLGKELQSFPIDAPRNHKLCLPDLPRQRVSRIEAAAHL